MKRLLFWSSILFINFSFAQKPTSYFPAADNWQHKSLVSFDIDSLKIADAIQFAKANEAKLPRNQELAQAMTFGKEPYSDPVGPL